MTEEAKRTDPELWERVKDEVTKVTARHFLLRADKACNFNILDVKTPK